MYLNDGIEVVEEDGLTVFDAVVEGNPQFLDLMTYTDGVRTHFPGMIFLGNYRTHVTVKVYYVDEPEQHGMPGGVGI